MDAPRIFTPEYYQRMRDLDRQQTLEKLGIWFIRIPSNRIESDLQGVLATSLGELSQHPVE